MRLHVVRHPAEEPVGPYDPSVASGRTLGGGAVGGRVSPDHPSVDQPIDRPGGPVDAAGIRSLDAGLSADRRIVTSATTVQTSSPFRGPDAWRRPTPYESGLAAVARHEVHIERVWPMRSPSTGSLEESSSAYFLGERRGTPPAGIVPVGGLRMNQAFPHEPVMAEEVVGLFAPVPPGLILDTTVGGGGHSAALLAANPGVTVLGLDRDPAAVAAASEVLSAFGGRAVIRQSRFDALAEVVADVQTALRTPLDQRGLSGVLFDLGVSSPNWTWPSGGSRTGGTRPST